MKQSFVEKAYKQQDEFGVKCLRTQGSSFPFKYCTRDSEKPSDQLFSILEMYVCTALCTHRHMVHSISVMLEEPEPGLCEGACGEGGSLLISFRSRPTPLRTTALGKPRGCLVPPIWDS